MPTLVAHAPPRILTPLQYGYLLHSVAEFLLGDHELMDGSHYLPLVRRRHAEAPWAWLQSAHVSSAVELATHQETVSLPVGLDEIATGIHAWLSEHVDPQRDVLMFVERHAPAQLPHQ